MRVFLKLNFMCLHLLLTSIPFSIKFGYGTKVKLFLPNIVIFSLVFYILL